MEPARISRRAVLGAGAAFAVRGQQAMPQGPSTPDEALKAAVEQQQANYEQMRKAGLPFFAEPATLFQP
jgi:hypothetical protein